MARWLYRYEAKSIQDYVLGTTRLREIAGASALVESLASKARAWVEALDGEAEVIVAAAGGATLEFRTDAALRSFASAWPLACARWCPGLQVIQAWAGFEGDQPTPATMDSLRRGLASARAAQRVDLPELTPVSMRAGRTGEAAVESREAREDVDGGCFGKEALAKDGRADDLALDRRFDPSARKDTFPRSLERFGEGYLAVIHADGNGVGRLIQEEVGPKGIERWRAFSAALADATQAAARGALGELRARVEGDDRLAFRPVVLGGDDLTVITRARDAIAFTADFLGAFEAATKARPGLRDGAGLTACAGVALVKPGFPFNAAARLAEELCKEAKKRATRGDGSHASCFAFHRVTTASVRGWDAIKEDELAEGRLVGGPWFVGDHPDRSFAALCGLVRHLADRDVPRGAIREWLTLAQDDRHAADKAWRRMMEVLEGAPLGPRVVQELRNTLRGLGADAQGWRQDGTTPVGDALAWLAVSSLAEVTGGRGGSK